MLACVVFEGLFVTPVVTAIVEALDAANATGKVAVVDNTKLAHALAEKREVVAVGKHEMASLADKSLAAVIGGDVTACTRAVREGGVIVLVDRGNAPEASRRALCAGLMDIEQRHAGRVVVTSGRVTHLALA